MSQEQPERLTDGDHRPRTDQTDDERATLDSPGTEHPPDADRLAAERRDVDSPVKGATENTTLERLGPSILGYGAGFGTHSESGDAILPTDQREGSP